MSDDECPRTPMGKRFLHNFDSEFQTPEVPPTSGLLLILVHRDRWSAAPPGGAVAPLEPPAANVVLHWTDTPGCKSKEACSREVWLMQQRHRQMGREDIQYNFLVGSDGFVFEGLGWTKASAMLKEVSGASGVLRGDNVLIGLLGSRSVDSSILMKSSVSSLITTGIFEGFLEEDHGIYSLTDGNIFQDLNDNVNENIQDIE